MTQRKTGCQPCTAQPVSLNPYYGKVKVCKQVSYQISPLATMKSLYWTTLVIAATVMLSRLNLATSIVRNVQMNCVWRWQNGINQRKPASDPAKDCSQAPSCVPKTPIWKESGSMTILQFVIFDNTERQASPFPCPPA